MQFLSCQSPDFKAAFRALCCRPGYPPEIEKSVATIVHAVRQEGDAALFRFAKEFDHAVLNRKNMRVSKAEMAAAEKAVSSENKRAIREALRHIRSFAKERIPQPWHYSPRPGVLLGEKFVPMDRVGVYIPGGTAPLVSTVLHTAGIAAAAGVKEIVGCTPAKNGKVHPEVLFAMKCAGITEIYKLGGVYGVAAMACGTESIAKVEKIVGPGNAYVTAAKKLVYGGVAIDMVAGPSEIMVVADSTADPDFIAADLLSQAEHGSGLEQAVLVSTSRALFAKVEAALKKQKASLPRLATVDKVLKKGTFFIHARTLSEAAEVANAYAPEHLELQVKDPRKLAKEIRACGAVFLGKWTPEPIGDFCAGPSHVLPTAGSAHYFAGLSVEAFFRRMSLVQYSEKAVKEEAPIAAKFAAMEGLAAHGRSAMIRREKQ